MFTKCIGMNLNEFFFQLYKLLQKLQMHKEYLDLDVKFNDHVLKIQI